MPDRVNQVVLDQHVPKAIRALVKIGHRGRSFVRNGSSGSRMLVFIKDQPEAGARVRSRRRWRKQSRGLSAMTPQPEMPPMTCRALCAWVRRPAHSIARVPRENCRLQCGRGKTIRLGCLRGNESIAHGPSTKTTRRLPQADETAIARRCRHPRGAARRAGLDENRCAWPRRAESTGTSRPTAGLRRGGEARGNNPY